SVLLAGTAYMALVGRRLLPNRDPAREFSAAQARDFKSLYELDERMVILNVPSGSSLHGKTLAESRLGTVLGLNVVAVMRDGQTELSPTPTFTLQSNDRLLVEGQLDQLSELNGKNHLIVDKEGFSIERLVSADVEFLEVRLMHGSHMVGQSLLQMDFRQQYQGIVLAIRRGDMIYKTNIETVLLLPDDILLVQGWREQLTDLLHQPHLKFITLDSIADYKLEERFMVVHVPEDSRLVGKTLIDSRLADSYGLGVMGILRAGKTRLIPLPDEVIEAGDTLLVKGRQSDLHLVEGMQGLKVVTQTTPGLDELESDEIGLVEAVLSPHSSLVGKTLHELNFRLKYGLSVLAIWRQGRAYRSNLRDMPLFFGDALLLHGPRERLRILGREPDFLVLTEEAQEAPRQEKIPVALLVMGIVLVPVIFGWLPIAITAILGVTLMILSGCLTMEEAYRTINWTAIFLIAGMLPLGIAMSQTGASQLLASGMVEMIGGFGPMAVVAGFFILAALASQFIPNPAVAVLLAPIALNTASDLGISPYTLMMTVAVSASAAFLSPVGHSANVLVMGPGGYRFSDYVKVGLPLTLVVLAVVMIILPIIWPI
ncbi:MAG: anion permease, partial [Chloroflexi bacterium]|nr:anion permease [Chloroflexota bacterium]